MRRSIRRPAPFVRLPRDALEVTTGQGTLRLLEIQLDGKRPMTIRDVLNGWPIRPGERFRTAAEPIMSARALRPARILAAIDTGPYDARG